MPPPKGKRNAANTHDKRHENGLAAPGKRIPKLRSPPTPDGLANGKPPSCSPPLPPTDVNPPAAPSPAPGNVLAHAPNSDSQMPEDSSGRRPLGARGRTVSDTSHDGDDGPPLDHANGSVEPLPRPALQKPHLNGSRSSIAYKNSAASTAMTIISSCPVRDVVAILIILLQLPTTVLTIIQLLFATLTFVPPSSTASFSSLPSFSEVFKGSQGMPSLGTILLCDLLALIVWGLLPLFAQGIAFDLAQAVIAISLGGAAAGKGGVSQSVAVCASIIFCTHAYRHRSIRHYAIRWLHFVLSRSGFDLFSPPPPPSPYSDSSNFSHGWPRSVLGLHILSQGILRLGRRWFIAKQDRLPSATPGRRVDPEAAAAAQLPRSTPDAAIDSSSSAAADGRHPGPSPAGVDSRERSFSSSSKKKKRHATQVRSQQPFWAALASTKVTFWKEVQQSNDSADSNEANSTDVNHIGDAHFRVGEDRVWIMDVGATEITFGASVMEKNIDKESGGEEQESSLGAGIDRKKPFYVRLNGTNWASTSITGAGQDSTSGDGPASKWSGKIFGLTPQQNYKCEFVRTADRTTFHSTSLITQSAPSAEQASLSQPVHQSLRPQSPRTLLRNNVANLEHELQELRAQQKRNQRSHGKALAADKKEVDIVHGKIQTSGGADDRLKQKKRQLSEAIRQAEEATSDMAAQNIGLARIPEDESKEYAAEQRSWREENGRLSGAKKTQDRCKADADRDLANTESEYASIVKKRERLYARQSKLNEQHERLSSLNAQDRDAHDKKLNDRAVQLQARASHEAQYLGHIMQFEHTTTDLQRKVMEVNQQIQHMQVMYTQPAPPPGQTVPTTPEGPLPGTAGPAAAHNFTPVYQFPPLASQLNGSTPASFREGRGRSSSMLSDMSGFTDHNVDPPVHHHHSAGPVFGPLPSGPFGSSGSSMPFAPFAPPPPPPPPYLPPPSHLLTNGESGARKGSSESGSGGSGSGTGSAPASQRDPASPAVKTAHVSPVGAASSLVGGGGGGGGGHQQQQQQQ
ncbi:uncharacterized protein K452DRAFT_284724 [Aplosporella prunicola CBS 121167]|uniref:Ubiquitination network signaling protein n=1 Tax=Aplosporella prunicola CBS 121167 TaxID=1176127 RepID=A0A6A6BPD5_9PEZI|nr:uncharacterized protein K452DRAFT_284724 [Aplosporella prunicola CBS 121167]KAF2144411.1 hypothetical protein K452DRAFT_284724 [Aplosporella prunicola CBS 121167]